MALLLGVLVLVAGCSNAVAEKPEKLIDEKTMASILYDLSVLEAIKTKNPGMTGSTSEYIYKKYKIDSVQFSQNNRYYASEIGKYKSIYDEVNARLEADKNVADSVANVKNEKVTVPVMPNSNAPQIK